MNYVRKYVAELSAAVPSGKGFLAPHAEGVLLLFGVSAMISLTGAVAVAQSM